jgi:CHAT domain-containing protein
MRPVRRLLGDARRLFISPDGELNLIPFAALVGERGRYLVEDYTISYLTSGRDLLRLEVRPENRQGPLIVANPTFDQALTSEARRGGAEAKGAGALRSVDFKQLRFSYLPGAETEARALGVILPGATVLTGAEATEAALKQVSGPSLLHIATHGYFLPDQQQQTSENPLLRSGLGLAGANRREGGGGEDGVLTALEAAGLDLWGTRLVVLSACETGLGDVRNGDGVYGLRRALVLAGAESQVMSLWQVSDLPTRNLMVEYYRRLQRGEGRSEALRQAQLKLLRGKTHNHPFYWASFIQTGDWRSLDGKEPPAASDERRADQPRPAK